MQLLFVVFELKKKEKKKALDIIPPELAKAIKL